MLLCVNQQVQIVVRERKCLTIQCETANRTTEETENTEGLGKSLQNWELHFLFDATSLMRRCLTISYKTTAAATETFREGTLPSIGIDTRKSHLRFTRSCRPLPSPPSTRAVSML